MCVCVWVCVCVCVCKRARERLRARVCVCVKDKRGELSEHLAFEMLPNVKLTTFCLLGFGCENADWALPSNVVIRCCKIFSRVVTYAVFTVLFLFETHIWLLFLSFNCLLLFNFCIYIIFSFRFPCKNLQQIQNSHWKTAYPNWLIWFFML